MKDFLQRNIALLTGLLITSIVVSSILGVLLMGARDIQKEILSRIDQPASVQELPGLRGQISDRSRMQVTTLFSESPHVLGGWVSRINYEKNEVPFIHTWTRSQQLATFFERYTARQKSGLGVSSTELNSDSAQIIRNSEEARTGLIKCGLLTNTEVAKLMPGIEKIAHGMCRATVPPFDENVNIAVVVIIDVRGDQNSIEVQEVRRMLLQLQIDLFNRDFRGRETWARQGFPIGR